MPFIDCNIIDFFAKTKDKRVYGIGKSKRLDTNCLLRCPEYDICDRLYKIVDSNERICGKKYVSQQNKKIDIISFRQLCDEIREDDELLIITVDYQSALQQIQENNMLNKNNYYILTMIYDFSDSVFSPADLAKYNDSGYQIPSVIHYCWFGKGEIPQERRKYMDSWNKYCPDYEIRLWDENNYDVTKNEFMRRAYERKRFDFVSDYARLDIIEQNGGIYLDTDVELLKNLDPLRKFKAYAGFESTQMVNTGLGVAAIAGSTYIRKFMKTYETMEFDESREILPCTVYQTGVLAKDGLRRDNSYQEINGGEIVILPTEFLCGIRLYTKQKQITENTFSVHHFGSKI